MTSDRIWGVLYSKSKNMKIMNTNIDTNSNANASRPIENHEPLTHSNFTDSQFSSPIQDQASSIEHPAPHPSDSCELVSISEPASPSETSESGQLSTINSETINGSKLLHEVCSRFEHFLVLPPGASVALTLWTAHAHCFTAFRLTPRLNLQSPEPGCGKTTTLDVIASLVPRPIRTENLTAPILFRLVDQSQPTLLLDEVDSYLPQAEELRGLLNAGHKRGACAYRCGHGKSNSLRTFKAFAPAVLSGLGKLPGTLHDRSIHIPLIQAEPGQIKAWFDEFQADLEAGLNQQLARWTKENFEAIQNCRPAMPATAHNRLGDNWRPLFAIAEIAGGDWPQLAVDAFARLTSSTTPLLHSLGDGGSTLDSPGLLAAIRDIFAASGQQRIFSRDLVASLNLIQNRPWAEVLRGKPMTELWLSDRLRPYGIRPRNIKINSVQAKGYLYSDCVDVFRRYLTRADLTQRSGIPEDTGGAPDNTGRTA